MTDNSSQNVPGSNSTNGLNTTSQTEDVISKKKDTCHLKKRQQLIDELRLYNIEIEWSTKK